MHVEVTGTAADFMRYDFAEMKDVCKEFLTLVAGILVFSVTFAEKIVGLKGSGRWPLLTSWVLLVLALVLGGCSLGSMELAGGAAVYGRPEDIYHRLESQAVMLALLGGVAFILALASIVFAGALSLFHKQETVDAM